MPATILQPAPGTEPPRVTRAATIGSLFRDRVARSADMEAFRYPRGTGWDSSSWREVAGRVDALAAGLIALGVEAEQRVAIASSTRYEWVLADLAVMCAGGATTTIYPSTIASEVAWIVADSGSCIVFAEDDGQIAKLREHRSEIPNVAKVVTLDGTPDGDWIISFVELEALGRARLEREPDVVTARIAATSPDDLATLVYTSGTTGRPKGVRLRHDSWTYLASAVEQLGILHTDDVQFLWLPLAHVFGKVLLLLPLQIGFPTAVDGTIEKIVDNLATIRPTFMGAAPRIFEKAYARVATTVSSESPFRQRLFHWAEHIGRRFAAVRRDGGRPGVGLVLRHALADRLVLRRIRLRFGGRIRFFISGSAPLNRDIAEWFDAMGLCILEGYGMTESSAASFVNRLNAYRLGTVGLALPGTEARIAPDGEILLRGPGVMAGYHHLPDATAEAIDADGWLHTGDIGDIDAAGYLRITDRKKDLFKTSGGKYIAPSNIEAMFKSICPYVSQLMVYGEGRNFVSAL
ncbi:MAG: AMP-dependent synthetase/ligase, partial [Gemmatimonadaceae bacterium]